MPDVRMPDGTVIRNVPEGTTQSELTARLAKMRGSMPDGRAPSTAEMGPSDLSGSQIEQLARREVAQQAEAIQNETPFFQRVQERFGPGELAPQLGMGAAMMVPGAGWGSLALSSLIGGGTTALGEMAKQKIRGEPIDVVGAAKSGAVEGAGNFAGGAILKGLGATARAIFSSPLDDAAKGAAQFAREQGAPFPLSSAAPGSSAARIQ